MRMQKKIVALMLCFVLMMPVNAMAKTAEEKEKSYEDALDSGYDIAYMMYILSEYYVGKDVTYEEMKEAAMSAMAELFDDYTTYFNKVNYAKYNSLFSNSAVGIGVSYSIGKDGYLLIEEVYGGTPADEAGIEAGGKISKVNGKDVKGKTSDEIVEMFNEFADKVSIDILGSGKTLELKKAVFSAGTNVYGLDLSLLGIKDADPTVGFIYVDMFGENCGEDFKKEIARLQKEGVTKLILDLRGNPGGDLDEGIAFSEAIIPAGPIMYTYNKDEQLSAVNSELAKTPFEKMIVMVDENTASCSEIVASAVQDSGVGIIFGETTYGKGVIQSVYEFDAGDAFKFTSEEYFRRSKAKLNGIGVIPDVFYQYPRYIEIAEDGTVDVANVKHILSLLGYNISMFNNENDENFKSELKKYQIAYKLETSGKMNELTAAQMNLDIYGYYEADRELFAAYAEMVK